MISYSYRRLSEMLNAAERFNINTPFLWGHWGPVAGEIFHFFPNRTFSSCWHKRAIQLFKLVKILGAQTTAQITTTTTAPKKI
jgi:hypothetical protein